MEPVEASKPIDLNSDPRHEESAKSHGRLASVLMSREGRDGSRETAQPVDSEKNDARNHLIADSCSASFEPTTINVRTVLSFNFWGSSSSV